MTAPGQRREIPQRMDAIIRVEQLEVEYRARGFRQPRKHAVKGISFEVQAGEVFGFLGPNGAGKTTTMQVLLGFTPATLGRAELFGVDVQRPIARQRIGYLPELTYYYKFLTAEELLRFYARIFGLDSPWAVLAVVVVMTMVAAATIAKRAPDAPHGTTGVSFLAMLAVGLFVTFTVTGLVIQVEPWYLPQYVIPIAGMVLGNSMSGIALALERAFSDMDAHEGEILAMTALGATPWEASAPSIRRAMRAALIPGINTLSAAGIVFIPGMMAGQLLAGADPLTAAPYQIVVMVMVATADVLGSTLALLLLYRRRFTKDDVYLERGHRDNS